MVKGKISPSELKRQKEHVRRCEDQLESTKATVKEAKAELEKSILVLRAMARGENEDLDFAGDAERVGGARPCRLSSNPSPARRSAIRGSPRASGSRTWPAKRSCDASLAGSTGKVLHPSPEPCCARRPIGSAYGAT